MYQLVVKVLVSVACVLGFGSAALAGPILLINFAPGDARFDQTSGLFSARGTVLNAQGVSVNVPSTATVRVNALFSTASVISDPINGDTLEAHFLSAPGVDVQIGIGGDGSLLSGEFTSLAMAGGIGLDFGALLGSIAINGGSLASDFGAQGNLVSLQFNMTRPFSAMLFDQDFSASLNGSIAVGVPTPVPLLFVPFGLAAVAGLRLRRQH